MTGGARSIDGNVVALRARHARVARPAAAMACARGIAIILVVLYHADIDLAYRLPTYQRFLTVVVALRYVAVPLFLLCFGLAISGKAGSARRLVAEAINYVYIYLVWVAISVTLSALFVQANLAVPGSARSLLKAVVLPQSPLWFPYGLGLMSLSAALVVRFSRLTRLALAFAAGFIPLVVGADRVAVAAITANVVFFYAGLLFREEIFAFFKRDAGPACLAAGVGYASLLLSAERTGLTGFPLIYFVLGLLGFVALVSFWMIQPIELLSRPLAKLGRAALPILVLHDFWIHVAEHLPLLQRLSNLHEGAGFILPLYVGGFGLLGSYVTFRIVGRTPGLFTAPSAVLSGGVAGARRAAHLLGLSERRPAGPPE